VKSLDNLPAPLSDEETDMWLQKLAVGDEEAQKTLVSHNLRLVMYIALKFNSTPIELEDLFSIGVIGLIKGIRSYKFGHNTRLATYTSRCIENEILMYLRNRKKSVGNLYLDEPMDCDADGNPVCLSDILYDGDNLVEEITEQQALSAQAQIELCKLPTRARTILEMRYGLHGHAEKTQLEVSEELGISQSYVSRLEKKVLATLRKKIDSQFV
jgi:RNA polymerase sporulation-specific sigma factor